MPLKVSLSCCNYDWHGNMEYNGEKFFIRRSTKSDVFAVTIDIAGY